MKIEACQFSGRHGLKLEALCLNANAKSIFRAKIAENKFQEKIFSLESEFEEKISRKIAEHLLLDTFRTFYK